MRSSAVSRWKPVASPSVLQARSGEARQSAASTRSRSAGATDEDGVSGDAVLGGTTASAGRVSPAVNSTAAAPMPSALIVDLFMMGSMGDGG
ncbi:hypothetical protein AB0L65_57965 [Nonomuraea sp. NPDC052116]|uniref:hypothetical protein n=1 Tax=Nonomuraea sp. NPDC052116 TaxID=3155665 RepID=UPI00342001B0